MARVFLVMGDSMSRERMDWWVLEGVSISSGNDISIRYGLFCGEGSGHVADQCDDRVALCGGGREGRAEVRGARARSGDADAWCPR